MLVTKLGKTYNFTLQIEAIRAAVDGIKYYNILIHKVDYGGQNMLVKMLVTLKKYTVVAYPISHHFEIIKKRNHCLENKPFLTLNLKGRQQTLVKGVADKLNLYLLYYTGLITVLLRLEDCNIK